MQNGGSSIRLVLPEFNSLALASVVVTKNQLIEKGAEICVIPDTKQIFIGKTLVVQDFEDYGRRDYQRPFRDDRQGMIPPKVAQIMINLSASKPGSVLLDPFCGMGTIVQEGVLLGHKVVGTDLERFNISSAEKNLEWFRNRYKLPKTRYHVEASDARHASKVIQNLISTKAINGVNSIVTEGTLGPVYSKFPKTSDIEKNFEDLSKLYSEVFEDVNLYLKTGGSVVMCLPCYKKNANEYIRFKDLDFITSKGYHIESLIKPALAEKMPFLRLTSRGTAIYDRKDQIVAREIVNFIKD
jgi:tRNA G10  N-methylase Trm11